MGGPDDYYGMLGVPPDAGPERIRAAWHRACFRFHPDAGSGEADPVRLREARQAYLVLSDPVARARYDRRRRGTLTPPGPRILSLDNIRRNWIFLAGGVRRLSRSLLERLLGP